MKLDEQETSVMQRLRLKRFISYFAVLVVIVVMSRLWCHSNLYSADMVPVNQVQYMSDGHHSYPYDRHMPLIFIGGMPRSGTTLMRAMLDAHPEVRCGEETRVIPRLLGLKTQWQKSDKESKRLIEAGLTDDVLSSAIAAFILEVIAKHGEPAPRLCNKDPFALKSMVELSGMFPNSKYLLMIRDGRAVVHSIISRKVSISGFDLKNFRSCLEKWNAAVENMYIQCLRVGSSRCLPVYYEQLVLHPQQMLHNILTFLDIPWHDSVLHHEQHINKPGGISLSKIEKSTDQVIKPVNLEGLSHWVDSVPLDVRRDIRQIAPMLARLGYDPDAYPPNYGEADTIVANNTQLIKQNEVYWQRKALDIQQMTKLPLLANAGLDVEATTKYLPSPSNR
jgi:protein-tyrosine sulfotransferase